VWAALEEVAARDVSHSVMRGMLARFDTAALKRRPPTNLHETEAVVQQLLQISTAAASPTNDAEEIGSGQVDAVVSDSRTADNAVPTPRRSAAAAALQELSNVDGTAPTKRKGKARRSNQQ